MIGIRGCAVVVLRAMAIGVQSPMAEFESPVYCRAMADRLLVEGGLAATAEAVVAALRLMRRHDAWPSLRS